MKQFIFPILLLYFEQFLSRYSTKLLMLLYIQNCFLNESECLKMDDTIDRMNIWNYKHDYLNKTFTRKITETIKVGRKDFFRQRNRNYSSQTPHKLLLQLESEQFTAKTSGMRHRSKIYPVVFQFP